MGGDAAGARLDSRRCPRDGRLRAAERGRVWCARYARRQRGGRQSISRTDRFARERSVYGRSGPQRPCQRCLRAAAVAARRDRSRRLSRPGQEPVLQSDHADDRQRRAEPARRHVCGGRPRSGRRGELWRRARTADRRRYGAGVRQSLQHRAAEPAQRGEPALRRRQPDRKPARRLRPDGNGQPSGRHHRSRRCPQRAELRRQPGARRRGAAARHPAQHAHAACQHRDPDGAPRQHHGRHADHHEQASLQSAVALAVVHWRPRGGRRRRVRLGGQWAW